VKGRSAAIAYGCASVAYAGAIFWASSLPRLSFPNAAGQACSLATNLFHVPLYATLSFLIARALSSGRSDAPSWRLSTLALLLAGVSAALDEWHQSFVPGRTGALSDFLLDVAGIGWMLLLLSFETRMEVDS